MASKVREEASGSEDQNGSELEESSPVVAHNIAHVAPRARESSFNEDDETTDTSSSSDEEQDEDESSSEDQTHQSTSSAHSRSTIPPGPPLPNQSHIPAAAAVPLAVPLAAQRQTSNREANSSVPTSAPTNTQASRHGPPSASNATTSSSSMASSSAPLASHDAHGQSNQNAASTANAPAKHRRWRPFAKKEVTVADLDTKIQHYRQLSDEELAKSESAGGRLQHNNAIVKDSHAPFGSRISNFFKKFNNWNDEKSHKSTHDSLQSKISKLQTKRAQIIQDAAKPH